ncbi:Predicted metalloprotease [Porphyromonas macacae]|uniref:Predicted metalloprotease n=1 Tax=Porphyromonas macacae TaxID=28115 RepID=A0A379E642_9PORP|nr:neutral zinc metallopeptidase [Porphyromonas macacae]SUB88178.1 Predicted metalloprotease [Porphyromonas macacae]
MKWIKKNNDTGNFDDRRGRVSSKNVLGGIGGIIVLLLALFLGQDPGKLLEIANTAMGDRAKEETIDPGRAHEYEEWKDFTLNVFNSCNDVWTDIFNKQLNKNYEKPTLVVYTDQTHSGCGGAMAQMGPFYCPADIKVYIDLSFFKELSERFKAPGDLAMAYVTAHEVGHHVQKLLGILDAFHSQRGKISQKEYNKLNVKVELQADFFAGLWAHYAQKMGIIELEEGDLEEALNAAHAIGDDTLQKAANGRAAPDTFTHGTSAQRMTWFKKGFLTGDFRQGDTFNDPSLN